jgi:hypothetical protein
MVTMTVTGTSDKRHDLLARRAALVALLAANFVVAIMAFRDNRGFQMLLFVYWAETLVIAIFNLPKMLIAGLARQSTPDADPGRATGRAAALVVGLGAYATLVTMLLLLVFVAVGFFSVFLRHADGGALWRLPRGDDAQVAAVAWSAAAFALSHALSFGANFIYRREYRSASLLRLAMQPFLRTALLVALMLGGSLLMRLQPAVAATTLFTGALVLLKLLIDVQAHRAERRRLQPPG